MKRDIILAGVGGQGVLSVATVITRAAVESAFQVRQSEVHGMAQRGGAVVAHLRIADSSIYSDLIPQGSADLIISMEPLESLRYAAWLSPQGALVSASEPVVNIPDYPQLEAIHQVIAGFPISRLIPAEAIAREAGHVRAVNMVMVGAAAPFLPLDADLLEKTIDQLFGTRYPGMVEINRRAFRLGQTRE